LTLRALFLSLLLANILFLAWVRWIAPPPAPAGHATPASPASGKIRLLREAPLGRELASAAASSPSGQGAACVSAGPYLSRAAAEQAAARLQGRGYTSRLRPSRDEVWVGQWVRVANLATPEDVANALTTLRASGIGDAYVLQDEAPGSVISLGVFGDEQGAAQVAAVARQAGFAPEVVDRFRTADVVWIDIDRQANAGLPDLEALGGGDRPGNRLELKACPAGA
jgi:hypothetical protein